MNDTYSAIKNLLAVFIGNSTPNIDNVDFEKLYLISRQQHIDGIIGYVIDTNKLCNDKKISKLFFNSYFSAIAVNTNQIEKYNEFKNQLLNNKIDFAVFKGCSIRTLYSIPELRSFSDIDIYIRKEDRSKSHQLMLDLGYQSTVDYGAVYGYKKGIEYYELHDTLISEDILNSDELNNYFVDAWSHMTINDNGIYEFDDDFHLIYLIAHIAKHIHFGGAGIRMYLDIALFIKNKSSDFDFESFFKTTKALKIDKFAHTVICAACTWFNVDIPQTFTAEFNTPADTLEQLYNFTIDKGIFGNTASSTGEATVQIMKRNGSKHPRLCALISIAFPPLNVMKLKHAYLEKAPVLLPIAWTQRAFTNISKIKTKKQNVKDIISTNKDTISKLSELNIKIGL